MASEAYREVAECVRTTLKRVYTLIGLSITLDIIRETYYYIGMIRSFKSKETEKIFSAEYSAKLPQAIQRVAYRRLLNLDAAEELNDLSAIPGNRFEKLKGDREGQYSIRINDQWRICFIWRDGNAYEVEIVDYH